MDPNETLTKLRDLIGEIFETNEADDDCTDMAVEMAELFDALDGWIIKGGFLPDAWSKVK